MPRWPATREIEPAAATNTRFGFVGSTAIRPIAAESTRPQCCQWPPPSVDLYIPSPKYVRPPPDGFASPVPAQSVPSGPRAMAPMTWVCSSGQTFVKVEPASVVFQTPPPETAVYIVSGLSGSTTRSTIRAPMFDGPTSDHEAFEPCGIAAACFLARFTIACVTSCPDVHLSVR